MSSIVEDAGPCQKLLKIEVEVDRIDEEFAKTYRELRGTVSLPGFRKGKAPRALLEKRFGDHVSADVKRDLILAGLREALEEHSLEMVLDPNLDIDSIDFDPKTPIAYEVTVDVRPDVELEDYEGITAIKKVDVVTDADIDAEIEQVCKQRSFMAPVEDEASVKGDMIIGSLIVKEGDEVVFEREDAHLEAGDDRIAAIPLSDDAIESLTTCKAEAEVSWTSTIDDEHPMSALKGKTVEAAFTVGEVKRITQPSVEEMIAELDDVDDIDVLKQRIGHSLLHRKGHEATEAVEEQIIDTLLTRTDFPIPDAMVERQLKSQTRETLMRRLMAGEQVSDPEAAGRELEDELRPKIERGIRAWYVFQHIAKREKIFATEDDFHMRVQQMAMSRDQTPTQVIEDIEKHEMSDGILADILEGKVRSWLTEHASVTEEVGEGAPSVFAAHTDCEEAEGEETGAKAPSD